MIFAGTKSMCKHFLKNFCLLWRTAAVI